MSQPFIIVFCYWYNLWYCWLITGVWTCLANGWSAIFWELASCWPQVYCGNITWVKSKIPWLGGISLASHTCGDSFRVFFNVYANSLWDVPSFYLASHAWYVCLSVVLPTLPGKHGCSWYFLNSKGDNKVEIKLEVLVGLVVFVVSTLSLLHVIVVLNSLVTPPSWYLIYFWNDEAFHLPIFLAYSLTWSITDFSEAFAPSGGSAFWSVCLVQIFDSSLEFAIRLTCLCIL